MIAGKCFALYVDIDFSKIQLFQLARLTSSIEIYRYLINFEFEK